MKIDRTKNATRNILFGGILKIYQIIMPFIMRTVMIYCMGVEYLGLNSLFASVLQTLNLAELGVGSAMIYSMYKPIVDDDEKKIDALMRLYKIYYRIIGLVVATCGIILLPFIPRLVKSGLPAGLNIYILYLMNLGTTVLSYWLFAYKNSLFYAHQRIDVTNKISIIVNTIQYGVQLVIIIIIKNYYLYVLVALATQAVTNIATSKAADRFYPKYKAVGKLSHEEVKEINHRIRDLFTSKIGAVIVNSADTIVISAFLGLTMLAIYQNYFYILSSILGIVSVIFTACSAGIGNSIIIETKEKNFNDLKKFTFLMSWIAGICSCCFLCLFQPFMKLWVGDKLLLPFSAVVCFCIYYYVYEINQLLNTYKDAAGIWHEDRFRPLVTALANLSLNLILVQFWGIYGVLLSTVISMLVVGMPWLLYNLFTVLFNRKQFPLYLRCLVKYIIVVFVSCLLCYSVCCFITFGKWSTLIIRIVICCVLPNIFYYIVYRKSPEFTQCIYLFDKMTRGKLKLSKLIEK